MTLVGGMISTCRFSEFVREIYRIHNKDIEDETLWEYWLHKVFDVSYQDFRASIGTKDKYITVPPDEIIKKTIKDSFDMLNGFNPAEVDGNGAFQAAGNGGS